MEERDFCPAGGFDMGGAASGFARDEEGTDKGRPGDAVSGGLVVVELGARLYADADEETGGLHEELVRFLRGYEIVGVHKF